MKTLLRDRCDHEARGETFEAWMEALKPHYAQAHADFMQEQGQKSGEEQKVSMQTWIMENKAWFNTA